MNQTAPADARPRTIGKLVALTFYLVRMDLTARAAAGAFGLVWTFLTPLCTILVIWLALDYGLGMRTALGPDYGRGLAVGLAAWLFFLDAVMAATAAISGAPHLVKKVVFPVFLLPVAAVLSRALIHAVVLVCVVVLVLLTGAAPGPSLLLLPLFVTLLTFFAAAVGLFMAALNVGARDAQAAAGPALGLLFWLTPIIWPLSNIPDPWRFLVYLNPVAGLIDGYRYAALGAAFPASAATMLVGGIAFLTMGLVSVMLFQRLRPMFADAL